MRWRRRPRAASLVLLSAAALIVVPIGLRDPAPVLDSINATLTRDAAGCAGVRGTSWHPLSGVDYTGRLDVTLPASYGGAMLLFVGDALPLALEASDEQGEPVAMHAERLVTGPGIVVPPDFWLDDGSPAHAPRHLSRVQLDAAGERERHITLSLGRRAPRVLARLVGYPATVIAPVCAVTIAPSETYFGAGWYGSEQHPDETAIRWMREYGAVMVGSSHGNGIRIAARLASAVPDVTVNVRVNDIFDLEPVPVTTEFRDYEWRVPDAVWLTGTNELLFSVAGAARVGTRRLGVALASLHVH